jgi:hypothetical protein
MAKEKTTKKAAPAAKPKAGKTDEVIKVKPFVRDLEVVLSREEVEDASNRMAHLVHDYDLQEHKFKEQAKLNRSVLADMTSEIRKLSNTVSNKTEYRDIACEQVLNYTTGRVTERRKDTGEVLSERDMTESERQRDLGIEDEFGDDSEDPDIKFTDAETSEGEEQDESDEAAE